MAREENMMEFMITIQGLLSSGEYSDFTITCGDDTYAVHKAIICPRSDFFAKAVKFGKEAEENKIVLVEDEPEIVKLMIQYLYELDYDEPKLPTLDISSDDDLELTAFKELAIIKGGKHKAAKPAAPATDRNPMMLITHAKVYAIADKYNILGLKEVVIDKFEEECKYSWDDPAFPMAIGVIFESTPNIDKGLRDIAVATISNHMELLHKPEIEALMIEYNGLAFGLLRWKALQYQW
ncbi:hypothetical protein K432DRAFT_466403 [Lepidopterella palustris CBS 459.81]|uniref:BTB domain-containing protein n=1 Tax=Lepidopterella palustris CBS 459.81 TaxID=1314670 RepID=A0A8E2E118_9PEZI|nr:hypothetical protein K432DRAFT_466403 [Lepidopterella palustris CBS 459.81]